MEQKDYLKIKHNLEKAEEDTKPVVGVVNDEIVVNGDVNNIKVEPKDYTLRFILPEHMAIGTDAKIRGDGYAELEIEYKNVFPTVKDNMKYTSALMQLFPFYKRLKENGDIDDLTDSESVAEIFAMLDDEVVDALYRFVSVALGVDKKLADYMAIGSVLEVGGKIITDFPSTVNQADLFFG